MQFYHLQGKEFMKYACGREKFLSGNHPAIWYDDGKFYFNGVETKIQPTEICWDCLNAVGLLMIKCAWCGKVLGYKEGKSPDYMPITHSICSECKDQVLKGEA